MVKRRTEEKLSYFVLLRLISFFLYLTFILSKAGTTQLFVLYSGTTNLSSRGSVLRLFFFIAGLLEIVWVVGLKYTRFYASNTDIITISAML